MHATKWFLLLAVAAAACQDPSSPLDGPTGQVVVLVSWQDQGIPGKRLELLPIGEARVTDANGFAAFAVPAGDYVVRAYEINRGGPVRPFIDFKATVTESATTRVVVVDCVECDAPDRPSRSAS